MQFLKRRFSISLDYLAVILIASQLCKNIYCQNLSEYQIYIHPIVPVQRGLCAYVPCMFTVPTNISLSKDTNGLWYRLGVDAGHRVASRENSKYYSNGRISLIGNVTRRDCSLYIEDPLSADEGAYVFRIEDPQMKFTYTNIILNVTVIDLTNKPIISSTRLVDGKEVTMTCTSPGRCRSIAPPRISWEGAMTGTSQMMYHIPYEDGGRSFHSIFTFMPRKLQRNSTLFCRVTFQHNVTIVKEQTLNIEYSPSINITVEGVNTNDTATVIVEDGDSVSLNCIVDSNPNASVTWYKEDVVVHQNISDQIVTLKLFDITKRDAGKYLCSAMNEHGVTHRKVEIIYQNNGSRGSNINTHGHIILSASIGAVCILLFAFLVFACWRKTRRKSLNIETEPTYTDLRRSEITEIYDQLKPWTQADTAIVGSDVGVANDYENVQKQHR
ncbi:sialic acid-binding Ig-like lectin 13 isoform X1 [Anomaloglossus baeobatrachus]|uniref:sialic acid-binding Ig-like lectin 13 isoform X1 n=1 Tax=Anomaloglossus baeobatrachus TaxID=238106 RepID=UPI003F50398F